MITNPTWANFDLGRALQESGQPLATLAGGRTQLALQNLARRQQLADVASARDFEQTAAGLASQRRMKEFEEAERVRAVEGAAQAGVPGVTADDTIDVVGKKIRDYKQNSALATLSIYDAQLKSAQANQQARLQAALQAVNSNGMGTPEQRRRALELTLTDAKVVGSLPSDVVTQLRGILASQQDPQKAVAQVVQEMQSKGSYLFSLLPGVHSPGTWRDRAQNFFQTYQQNLQPAVDASKQADLALAVKQLDDSNRQMETVVSKASGHLEANAGLLPPTVLKDWGSRLGPPQDPNVMLKDIVAPGTPVTGAAPATTPAPQPQPASNPATPTAGQIIQDRGLVGLARSGLTSPQAPTAATVPLSLAANAALGPTLGPIAGMALPGSRNNLAALAGNIAAVPTVGRNLLFGSNAGQPISPQALLVNRVRLDLQNDPDPKPIPASPQEILQAHDLNGQLYGISAEQSQSNLAAMMSDPKKAPIAVASLNTLIRMNRARAAGMPLAGVPPAASAMGAPMPSPVAGTTGTTPPSPAPVAVGPGYDDERQ